MKVKNFTESARKLILCKASKKIYVLPVKAFEKLQNLTLFDSMKLSLFRFMQNYKKIKTTAVSILKSLCYEKHFKLIYFRLFQGERGDPGLPGTDGIPGS